MNSEDGNFSGNISGDVVTARAVVVAPYVQIVTPVGTATISGGNGSPEGVVTANVGSLYMRLDGGALTSLYVKETGTGDTGWAAK